jgi:hypothetical protein
MASRRFVHLLLGATCAGLAAIGAAAASQTGASAPPAVAADQPLFAAEIKVGPNWDAAKPAHEQRFFKEHSLNLRRLREAGHLVMGARYSDKGLVVLSAATIEDARALLAPDPSFGAGVFAYELHPFNVFYPGTLQGRRPQAAGK